MACKHNEKIAMLRLDDLVMKKEASNGSTHGMTL
jgi:hypothetical protein